MISAPLAETFLSIQGEGWWVGVPQIFVRVRGCDLSCLYCDTVWAQALTGDTVTLPELLATIDAFRTEAPRLHSLALTGGEPLHCPEFALALGEALAERKLPLYLETAGHLPEALARVISVAQYVSLDYKLPSTLAEPVPVERFLESAALAIQAECFVKIVVTDRTPEDELAEAARGLAGVSPDLPVVLQPVSGSSSAGREPSAAQLLAWQALLSERLSQVRVIPQCHKLMGVR